MKTFKYLLCTFLAMTLGLASCSDDVEYTPGAAADGVQVFFPENIATSYNISDDVTSIAIPVKRVVKDAALNMPILADDESGLFNIPSSVSFAAGAESAELLITFDRAKLEEGKEYPLSILLNDEINTTPYGNSSLFIAVTPWPWVKLGTGKFREGWLSDVFNPNFIEIDVNIHKHKSKEGIYMIEEMFGWPYMTAFFGGTKDQLSQQFSYDSSNITIDCSNPAQVVIAKQWSGITENSNGYGQFMILSRKPGTLENGIITFPTNGVGCDFVGSGHKFDCNASGSFRIILPGYEATNYSLSAAYGGMKVGADNETTSAVIDFSYGDDVTGISYVLAAGDVTATAEQIAEQIAAGTAENIYEIKDFVAGSEKVSIEAKLEKGTYTVVALPKDKANKLVAKEVAASSFYFPGMGGSVPDCDVAAELMLVSDFNPEKLEEYPDHTSLAMVISGTELTEVRYYINTSEMIASIEDGTAGVTMQEVLDAYAAKLTAAQLEAIAANGEWGGIFSKRTPGTLYRVVVEAKNSYGKKALIITEPVATANVPYSGELVVGEYSMIYKANEQTTFRNTFNMQATIGSETEFHVYNIGTDDGSIWYATYDPAASTLTLSGVQVGYEDEGNCFGDLWGYWNAAQTQGYGFYSFANEESKGADPLVITVDKSTKQLSKLNNQLQVPVFDLASGTPIGYAGFFVFDTPITRVAAPSAASLQHVRPVKIPFSSIIVPTITKNSLNRSFRVVTAETMHKAGVSYNGFRTLNVKTAQCEPLPKQQGIRINFKENASLRAVK